MDMDITISINCDNAAFDGEDGEQELKYILEHMAAACVQNRWLHRGKIAGDIGAVFDTNGNRCGQVTVTP